MRTYARRLFAIGSAILLAAALVVPAAAVVSKSGTKYCSVGWTPYARSYSTGFTELFPPGSGYKAYNNGSTWTVRQWHSNYGDGGGFWFVQTNGSLNDPGTYAGCTNAS